MLYGIILATVAIAAAWIVYTLKSMRSIDIKSLVLRFLMKIGIFSLICKSGVRPVAIEITTSSGLKTIACNSTFQGTIEVVQSFQGREEDVFVATYPKAGTTWMQHIVWLILHNADFEGAKKEVVMKRYGFLEFIDGGELGKGLQSLENWPLDKRRLIKTHLPYSLLPKYAQSGKKSCKVIYVARNPKDLCVSYFHYHRMCSGFPNPGTWSEFLAKFRSGKLAWGCWFDHTLTYWKKYHENSGHIYFVKYEDLKKNFRAELASLARFLEQELTDEQLDAIAEHCSFESMSKNDATNFTNLQQYGFNFKAAKFMRKGEVGDWKNHFTLNENKAFDTLYEEKMKGSGLKFDFDPDTP